MIPHPYRYLDTYIGLELDSKLFAPFPDVVEWQETQFLKKDEFHATICKGEDIFLETGRGGLKRSESEELLLTLFASFVKQNPIKLKSLINDFRYMEDSERGRESIIVRCLVSNLSEFFLELNRVFKINMPLQPAHITLYTLQKNLGIHIPSEAVMENLTRVHLPELEIALSRRP